MGKVKNIKAIQYYPESLYNYLEQIENGLNIIYTNLKSELIIGNKTIKSRKFDTMLYNNENDMLILLMRDGNIDKEDIINYFEINNKKYVEINFDYDIFDYNEKDNIPELYFSREKDILEAALEDSYNKGITSCEFYPYTMCSLKLGYFTKYLEYINVCKTYFKGVVRLEDKVILIVNQKNNVDKLGRNRNMNEKSVLDTISQFGLYCDVILDREPNIYIENFSKKLKKIDKWR